MLAGVDGDDSAATIVECERQHGRLRVGYGCKFKSVTTAAAHNALDEWSLEHRDRGLGNDDPAREPRERLRDAV
eukprot:5747729-Alexandrium_andersonii.AAC.1